jgi:hypothetical protein
MRIRPALLGLFLATATTSCSFLLDFNELEGTGGSGGGSSIALLDLPDALAGALCDRLTRCAGDAAVELFLGEDDCKFLFSSVFHDSLFVGMPDLPPETFSYHPELAQQCVDAMRNQACTTFFDLPIECKNALDGLIGEGGQCTHPAQCSRGLYCNITGPCPGVCTKKPGEAEPCAAGKTCLEGLNCEKIDQQDTCVKPITQQDATCGGGSLPHCEFDMYCLGATDTVTGKCVLSSDLFTVKITGSACSVKSGPLCAAGFSCQVNDVAELGAGLNGTCEKEVAKGAPCKLALPDECSAGQYCNIPDVTKGIDGTCTDLPGTGQPCANHAYFAPDCAKATHCDQPSSLGTCRSVVTLGNACVDNSGCYSSYCQTGVCAPPNFCQ